MRRLGVLLPGAALAGMLAMAGCGRSSTVGGAPVTAPVTTPATSPASTAAPSSTAATTPGSTAKPGVTTTTAKAPPITRTPVTARKYAQWCATMAGLPDKVGPLKDLRLTDIDRVLADFKALQVGTPPEVKPNVDEVIAMFTKMAAAGKAGTLTSDPQQAERWMNANLGPDALVRLSDDLNKIFSFQGDYC